MAASGPVRTDKGKQGEAAALCVASSHRRPRSTLDDSHLCKEDEQDKKRAKRDKAAGGSFGPAKQVQQVRSIQKKEGANCCLEYLVGSARTFPGHFRHQLNGGRLMSRKHPCLAVGRCMHDSAKFLIILFKYNM